MANEAENIDKFDFYVTKIFAYLYSEFPVRQSLVTAHFISGDVDYTDDQDFSRKTDETVLFSSVVSWLADNGFIHVKSYSPDSAYCAYQCVLTSHALNALRLTPSSLDSDKSFGELFKAAAKIGTLEASKAAINKCVAAGIFAIGTLFT